MPLIFKAKEMPQIEFYYAPGACSLATHILLLESGAEFKAIPNTVNLDTVIFTEELQRINPKRRVPVLSIDGETITETPAIMTAISGLAPGKHFLGNSQLETIRAYEWMNWLSGSLHGHAFGGVLRPGRLTADSAAFEGIRAKGVENVRDCFGVIEGKLRGVHAVGDAFTAVDPYLFVFYRWANGMGFKMRE